MQAPADGRTTMEYENFEDQEDILPSDRVKETEDKENKEDKETIEKAIEIGLNNMT